ncbi:MAG: effector-associated domain EAD1-containing protein [Scytonema sp. PMC 1070.18]|nr:effector-associated domain EAD1-containing protein [Scytonema sp. PMC 1070.18]
MSRNQINEYPELTGDKKKEIRHALKEAYPNKNTLSIMISDSFESDELDINNITNSTYETFLDNLIKEAKSRGKLRKLVIAASKNNLDNPELRNCVQELLPVLLSDIDKSLLTYELFTSLINILKGFQDFAIVQNCCLNTISNIVDHKSKELEDIGNPGLASAVKWLIVLGLFLKDYPQKIDGIPYIVKFVDCLQRQVQSEIGEQLAEWMEQVKQHYNYQMPSCRHSSNQQNVKGYLLIFVRILNTAAQKENQNDSLRIHGFTCIETVKQNGSSQTYLTPLYDLEPFQCYDLTLVEENLKKWVYQAETRLRDEADKLRCPYDLTIEFFLPWEYWAESVDQWKVQMGPARSKKLEPIGKKHRVVVRSVDRLDESDLFNQLHKRWQKAEQFLQSRPSEREIQAEIEHLDCPAMVSDSQELTDRLESCQRIALKLTCVMPNCKISGSSRDISPLCESILLGGVPIAIWSRRCNLSGNSVASQMEQLLTLDKLCDLDNLLEEVKKKRKDARNDDKHLGHHLTILCDEPKRLRQIKQLLNKNKLWGMSA